MKNFFAFAFKEFIHIWRDKRTLTILLFMPAALIILFGFVISNEIKNAPLVILDKSKDISTNEIIDKFISSDYFKIIKIIESDKDLEKAFKSSNVKLAIIFPNNFDKEFVDGTEAFVQIIADASDPNTAKTLVSYAQSIILNYLSEKNEIQPNFSIDVRMRYNPEMKSAFLFIPGLITVLMMLIGAMMTSLSLTREREYGSFELLLSSPLNPLQIIFAKLVPYLLIALIDISTILILGNLVFDVTVKGSLFLLFAEVFIFILMALSLGILISTIAKTQQVALMISLIGLMLPTILLSDFIFPVENMPLWLRILSNIIPAKWFNQIIKAIMIKGLNIDLIWKETLILSGITLLFLSVSIKKFKIRVS